MQISRLTEPEVLEKLRVYRYPTEIEKEFKEPELAADCPFSGWQREVHQKYQPAPRIKEEIEPQIFQFL